MKWNKASEIRLFLREWSYKFELGYVGADIINLGHRKVSEERHQLIKIGVFTIWKPSHDLNTILLLPLKVFFEVVHDYCFLQRTTDAAYILN